MKHDKLLILDFGSQFTQLIARRVRESHIFCEVRPCVIPVEEIANYAPKGIILSGGPASVGTMDSPKIDPALFDLGIPILGICYGHQVMCKALGGMVEASDHREFGKSMLTLQLDHPLFKGAMQAGDASQVWMSHGDKVTQLPAGFQPIATTEAAVFAAIAHESKPFYGVQFHPEVVHTLHGATLLKNFGLDICDCKPDWNMAAFQQEEMAHIREQVEDSHVLCAVSGGVDSSVVATLMHKAIGDQLHCIFVDNGLLRLNEAERVHRDLVEKLGIPVKQVDASEMFLSRLAGVTDPERKRKIIGETFIEVFEDEAAKIEGASFLAQGTLYPDVIESLSFHGGPSVTIKSHHNVGGLPERMDLKLIEPVRALFKDEVRALGLELGMEESMIKRHPFPGPGLAIRIPGEITPEKLELLRKVDDVYISAIREAGLYDQIWQAFAVLLPVRSVGVMGDGRTYDYVCALRAVTSTDGMTAEYYPFDHAFLAEVSTRLINKINGINRVVYDVTSKPPGTIEWE